LRFSEEKVCRVIHAIGNTFSVAISLDIAIQGKAGDVRIKPGDNVGMTSSGGGYSIEAIVFEINDNKFINLVSTQKWPFFTISASIHGIACAAYFNTPPRNSLDL